VDDGIPSRGLYRVSSPFPAGLFMYWIIELGHALVQKLLDLQPWSEGPGGADKGIAGPAAVCKETSFFCHDGEVDKAARLLVVEREKEKMVATSRSSTRVCGENTIARPLTALAFFRQLHYSVSADEEAVLVSRHWCQDARITVTVPATPRPPTPIRCRLSLPVRITVRGRSHPEDGCFWR